MKFKEWLISEVELQPNSARDVLSMRNKLLKFVPEPQDKTLKEIEAILILGSPINGQSIQTVKRMVRSEKLFRRFEGS
jgi:hypothetical protein